MKGRLTAHFVRDVRHSGKVSAAGRPRADHHQDGGGLYLQVLPSGTKTWVQRIALNGRRYDYGLGSLADLGLLEARAAAASNLAQAQAYRRGVRRGEHPPVPGFERRRRATVERRSGPHRALGAGRGALTFAEAWELCIAERSRGWKDAATSLRSWRADLKHHLKALAQRPAAAVGVDDLRAVLASMKERTADKVLRRTGTVFDWVVAGGHRPDNPARTLRATWRGLAGNGSRGHHRALPPADAPGCYARLAAIDTPAAAALRLVFLTALRSGEARGARWEEIDLEARTWTVPAARMKDGRAHRVPLSEAACAVLRAARPRRAGLVLTGRRGREVTDKALLKVLADLGAASTVHGLRSTFRDWCGESEVPRELAEMSLAHTFGSDVERAYARSDLLARRAEVMQRWGRFLTGAA